MNEFCINDRWLEAQIIPDYGEIQNVWYDNKSHTMTIWEVVGVGTRDTFTDGDDPMDGVDSIGGVIRMLINGPKRVDHEQKHDFYKVIRENGSAFTIHINFVSEYKDRRYMGKVKVMSEIYAKLRIKNGVIVEVVKDWKCTSVLSDEIAVPTVRGDFRRSFDDGPEGFGSKTYALKINNVFKFQDKLYKEKTWYPGTKKEKEMTKCLP